MKCRQFLQLPELLLDGVLRRRHSTRQVINVLVPLQFRIDYDA